MDLGGGDPINLCAVLMKSCALMVGSGSRGRRALAEDALRWRPAGPAAGTGLRQHGVAPSLVT